MIKFHLEQAADGKEIVLDEPLAFTFCGTTYTVPAGFRSDGMSVPRWLWPVISPQITAQTLEPSIIHDYLYYIKVSTREEADQWYYLALIENGYSERKAKIVFRAVRLFGGRHWGQ